MRGVRYVAGVACAWLLASALGAFAALGPARAARGDWTAASVAASVAAAAVVAGLVWLGLRASRRLGIRIAVFVAAVPLVAIAALPVGIAFWATHPSHANLASPPPAGAVSVAIPVDGATLAAWYLPSHDGAAVVLSHGAGSTRDAVLAHAAVLADAGYGVLLVDARGHGESTGEAMDLGWWGERDLAAAVDALAAMPDVDAARIGLVGLSMGAEESLGAAGVDPRVRAVVAEGATSRTAQDKAGWLPGGPLGAIQRAMDAERDALLGMRTDAPKPGTLRGAVDASDAAILLITAGTVDNEAMAAEWIASGNDRVTVWDVPDASHTGGLSADPEEWERRVVGFLRDSLEGQGAS